MRKFTQERITKETKIKLELQVDGSGDYDVRTGIGFFDHMLHTFTRYASFNLRGTVKGDLEVDQHHTVEDVGIVLGTCLKEALGEKRGINRNGHCIYPMDEALVLAALDISGRGYLCFDFDFVVEKSGDFENRLVKEFFQSFAINSGATIHIKKMSGYSDHHSIEAAFKALGKSLFQACSINSSRPDAILSTKGII